MAADLFYLPYRPAIDANGIVVPGAKAYFYARGTTTPQSIYTDVALSIEATNPVTANAAGVWPTIYLDDTLEYRLKVTNGDDSVTFWDDTYIAGIVGEKGDKGDPGEGAGSLAFNQSAQETVVFDTFDRADATLSGTTVTYGSKTWSVTGPGGAFAKIEDGRLIGDDTQANSNFYATLDYGEQIDSISGVFTFEGRGLAGSAITSDGPQIVLIAQEDNAALTDMWHFQIRQNAWIVDKRIGGTWTNGIKGGKLHLERGVKYGAEMLIDKAGNRYRILIGGGAIVDTGWVTDADLANLGTLNKATWQIGGPQDATAHAFRPVWNACMIGPFKSAIPDLAIGGGSAGDIFSAKGLHGDVKALRRIPRFTAAADGWYRLFEDTSLSSFIIAGTLKFVARVPSTSGFTRGIYEIRNRAGGVPTITKISEMVQGNPVTQVRAHNDGTDCYIDINIPDATANNVEVDAIFEGWAIPYKYGYPETVSSTALTNSATINVSTATTATEASATLTASGWYSLLSGVTDISSQYIQGTYEVTVARVDDAASCYFLVDVFANDGAAGVENINIRHASKPGLVTQFRVSQQSGAVRFDAYFASATANNVEVTVRKIGNGYGKLGPIAAVGSALTGSSYTVSSLSDRQIEFANINLTDSVKIGGTVCLDGQGSAVADASGGTTIDTECRAQLNALLAELRGNKVIAT